MRALRTFAVVLVLAPLLAGCLEGGPPGAGKQVDPGEETVRLLAMGQHSAYPEPARRVFVSAEEWESFWEKHAANEIPTPPAPPVDFGSERAIAVVLAEKPSSCWSVRIEGAQTRAGVTSVEVVTLTARADTPCAQVMTRPFHFVAIPLRDTSVRFEETTQVPREFPQEGNEDPEEAPPEESPPEDAGTASNATGVRTLAVGGQTGLAGGRRDVVATQAAWESTWAAHGGSGAPPAVDFEAERAVVVTLGDKPNACWAVRVAGARIVGDGVVVDVVTYAPPPDAFCASVISRPYHLAAILAGTGPVSFEERQVRELPP